MISFRLDWLTSAGISLSLLCRGGGGGMCVQVEFKSHSHFGKFDHLKIIPTFCFSFDPLAS